MYSRRVLITGGAGFFGTHLAECLRRDRIYVRLFDEAACPDWASESDFEYVRGDIRDCTAVAAALEGIDVVAHAAFASPRQSKEAIWSVNVAGTQNLCKEALARGVRRFILISSTIVLKPQRVHPFFQNSPLTRLDLYRTSRVKAEAIVTESGRRELAVALVRPKTFIGPGRLSAFTLVFEWIRLGRSIPVLGRGENRYQLLDIRDMAEGIRLLVAIDVEGIFFFGAQDFRTTREDLQALLDHAQTGARLVFIPGWTARAALRGMELANLVPLSEWHYMSARGEDSVVDISRAEQELGWRPTRSNAQALIEAYDWYVESLMTTGMAKNTHPLPLAHRVLKEFQWIFPR
ncbi:MAG TPA: NAD-dependent epimerase/dehydratase family protein [Candidatus Hypogeohydataceae bacterium YC41]